MQKNEVKSSTVAGILGVFLGWVGGHDWYLGDSKRAITHVSLSVGGLVLLMIGIILDNLSRSVPVLNILFICLIIMAYVIFIGNLVWGMIEGVMILAHGDAGLAAKGYKVMDSGAPLTMANPNENPNNVNMTTPSVNEAQAAKAAETETKEQAGVSAVSGAGNEVSEVKVADTAAAGAAEGVDAGVAAKLGEESKERKVEALVNSVEGTGVAAVANGVAASLVNPSATANTTVPVGAAVQGGAMGDNADSARATTENQTTAEKSEDAVTLMEPRSTVPATPSDKEIADAAAAAVAQANEAMGK